MTAASAKDIAASLIDVDSAANRNYLKKAFYNAAANLFFMFVLGALVAVYYVLNIFLRPLLWAVLIGTFIFGFKQRCTELVQSWLRGLQEANRPLIIGLLLLPFQAILQASDILGKLVVDRLKYIFIGILCGLVIFALFFYQPFLAIYNTISEITNWFFILLDKFSVLWFRHFYFYSWSIILAYFGLVYVAPSYPNLSSSIEKACFPIWMLFAFSLTMLCGSYKMFFLIIFAVVFSIGAYVEIKSHLTATDDTDDADGEKSSSSSVNFIAEKGFITNLKRFFRQMKNSSHVEVAEDSSKSLVTYCFYSVFCGVAIIVISQNSWILIIIFFLFIVYLLRNFLNFIRFQRTISSALDVYGINEWFHKRRTVLLPNSLHRGFLIYLNGDKKISEALEASIGTILSIVFIISVIVGGVLFFISILFQTQSEMLNLVKIGGEIALQFRQKYPQYFNETDYVEDFITSAAEQGYEYGRTYIASSLTSEGINMDNQTLTTLLSVYDELYRSWVSRNTTNGTDASVMKSLDKNAISTVLSNFYNLAVLHIDSLTKIANSVWKVFETNLELFRKIFGALFYTILTSGSQILNFIFSFIVFISALFYLISSSNEDYRPMELIGKLMPDFGPLLADSFREAINGVFGASVKLIVFYGLYTWIIHSVFDVRLKFITSVVAALLAAVPIMASYFASLPGVLELWFVREKPLFAFIFFVLHALPSYGGFDTAVYAEITGGGHPYLTGLAVVGGIYFAGIEGAFFGPLLLCMLIVAAKVYVKIIKQ